MGNHDNFEIEGNHEREREGQGGGGTVGAVFQRQGWATIRHTQHQTTVSGAMSGSVCVYVCVCACPPPPHTHVSPKANQATTNPRQTPPRSMRSGGGGGQGKGPQPVALWAPLTSGSQVATTKHVRDTTRGTTNHVHATLKNRGRHGQRA